MEIVFPKEQLSNLGKTGKRFRGREAFKYTKVSHMEKNTQNNHGTSISSNTDYIPWATLLPETKKPGKP